MCIGVYTQENLIGEFYPKTGVLQKDLAKIILNLDKRAAVAH